MRGGLIIINLDYNG